MGRSVIEGLGEVESTSTLASTQLRYAALTITGGAGKLLAAATAGGGEMGSSSSSSGGVGVVTAAPAEVRWVVGGVVGVVGLVGL